MEIVLDSCQEGNCVAPVMSPIMQEQEASKGTPAQAETMSNYQWQTMTRTSNCHELQESTATGWVPEPLNNNKEALVPTRLGWVPKPPLGQVGTQVETGIQDAEHAGGEAIAFMSKMRKQHVVFEMRGIKVLCSTDDKGKIS